MKQEQPPARLRIAVHGVVQGVGFRPYIYRLATEMGLAGWVSNNAQGVQIEVEGHWKALETFLLRLEPEKPPQASIQSLEPVALDAVGYSTFEIRASDASGPKRTLVLPDLATCAECLRELFDPADRRYRYPFINCTHCGPRYSIIEALPYDRPNTTMRRFTLCAACRAEYEDPRNRRFHAQPNACPECGPHLELWDANGQVQAHREEALQAAAHALREGRIVAMKGIGGFLLLVDARNEAAVRRLRARKRREEKPFALLYPSVERIREDCVVYDLEERLLRSAQAPIVLLERQGESSIAPPRPPNSGGKHAPPAPQFWGEQDRLTHYDSPQSWGVRGAKTEAGEVQQDLSIATAVAPGNPSLGVMLPYAPLHHLLMTELGFPVVATSGNRSEEPICIDEREAVERLRDLADVFLVHDRPIARHVDDSVARVLLGRELILRRARGYAPLPITLPETHRPILAVGAHLKNAVALLVGQEAFISQHIGDLETAEAFTAFERVIADLSRLYETTPEVIACDLHPNYLSTQYAERSGLPLKRVQHHHAHVLSCMAENALKGPALGVSWDGTGYGTDGVIWGGEFLRTDGADFTRVAHLRPFRLPGGEQAIREPRRTALGLLTALYGESACVDETFAPVRASPPGEREVLRRMLSRNLNAPETTSMGRLFDAVAALLDIRQTARYEGQAAIELEAAAEAFETTDAYPLPLIADSPTANDFGILDWGPLVQAILMDQAQGIPIGLIAARFHSALIEAIIQVSRAGGEERVVLTGGCFLNRRLLEGAVLRLQAEGFRPYWHQRVPPGDGGIALGQIMAAARTKE